MIDGRRMALTFRRRESDVAAPWNGIYAMASTVGGSSVHWSGQCWRFYEDDFRVKSALEERYGRTGKLDYLTRDRAALADWPITYAEVEPLYDKVEYALGIGGWPGNLEGRIRPVNPHEGNPYEAPRKRDFPYRPLRDNATDLVFREGALARGLRPFHVATGVTMDNAWRSSEGVQRPGCTYCSFCTGFGCWNDSKTSSLSALLPVAERLPNFELRSQCYVTRVNHRDGRAMSVTYVNENGVEHEQPGELFIMGAYSFQNVRLLLHSGIDGNGQLGKYFINRATTQLQALFPEKHLNGWNGPSVQRQGVDDYNGENAMEQKLRLPEEQFFVRGAFIGSPSQRVPLESYDLVPPDVPTWGAAYKRYFTENLNHTMGLQLLSEALPYEDCALDLDPTYRDEYGMPYCRVTRSVKQNEVRMAHFIWDRAKELVVAAGATKVWGERSALSIASSTHDLGGARMGTDPTKSATNRYCQLWSMPNVFISGGAVAPTLSGHNPTQTIWMLSYWLADALLQRKVNLQDSMAYT
jgi:gluconate 2-dehydrogenase alpha chain